MSKTKQSRSKLMNWLLFIATVIIVILIVLLTTSIVERRVETIARLQPVREIPEWEPRNEIWGENYPKEYETYMMTRDTSFRSAHGGSSMVDYLEEYPELVILWAGYGFSKDYKQGRGHAYAVKDIRQTLRTGGVEDSPMPATCWTCKTTDVPRLMNLMGAEAFYAGKWKDLGAESVNPIGCQDCHDPKTMNLRITRPALIEAFERRGRKSKDFTHQEMRSLVCAQCHVEYYFKGSGAYLTFPWDKGFSADSMEAYYDSIEFSDWTHKLSRAPMLKAQHPDYELYLTGVHASRGVACADCHMPYKVEGGRKFTDHHIQSPLNNIANSCQVCHRESEEKLRNDVYSRQEKVLEIRRIVEKSLSKAHIEAKMAWDNGATESEMKEALTLIRHAQWRWDWVAAANGVGFHSPVEALRVLGTAIEKAEKARTLISLILAHRGFKLPVTLPDVSTKEKAQLYIGLDMESIKKDKDKLINVVLPEWDRKAKERQGSLQQY
jgi:nitrite reductase (cytochrome c-552)